MHHHQALRADGTHEDWNLSAAEAAVGILVFDVEHREMLEHLRQLYDGLAQSQPERRLRPALTRLLVVTKKHADHEEDYMRMLDYPAYRQHADDHLALRARLQTFMDEMFAEGASSEHNLAAVRIFFRKWLLDHILEHDRSLANFLAQRGIR